MTTTTTLHLFIITIAIPSTSATNVFAQDMGKISTHASMTKSSACITIPSQKTDWNNCKFSFNSIHFADMTEESLINANLTGTNVDGLDHSEVDMSCLGNLVCHGD